MLIRRLLKFADVARPEKTRQGLKLLRKHDGGGALVELQGLKKPDRD